MLHHHGNYSMADILDMTYRDREWFVDRLIKQAKADSAAVKKAMKGKR